MLSILASGSDPTGCSRHRARMHVVIRGIGLGVVLVTAAAYMLEVILTVMPGNLSMQVTLPLQSHLGMDKWLSIK